VATYKLIQDIEAEDKILGPLTLRQFIFALISIFFFYICFILLTKGGVYFLAVFLPPALFFGFFALPFGRDQPTEIWALAKLRYWFKPRRRIWDQSGVKELVTITVPKKVERVLSNGLSQTEVKSRLQALANTIDSRGWAIKNVDAYVSPTVMSGSSDRLLDIGAMPQAVSDDDIVPADDMLDAGSNPIAQQFESMITRSSRDHRQQLIDTLNDVRAKDAASPAADYWFMNGSAVPAAAPAIPTAVSIPAPIVTAPPETQSAPLPTMEDDAGEAVLSAQLHAQSQESTPYENMRTVQPLAVAPSAPQVPVTPPAVTPPADPAILSLANNDDFNVATLAREAKKAKGDTGDEVVIPLH
jgi:hypothetical protein